MNPEKTPLMLVSPRKIGKVFSRFRGMTRVVLRFFPDLGNDLNESGLNIKEDIYALGAFFNALIIGVFFIGLFSLLHNVMPQSTLSLSSILTYSVAFAFMFYTVFMVHPRILAGKRAEKVDQYLVFALKDLLLQLNSGILLYDALVNVSSAKYGSVSDDLGDVARQINVGVPTVKALENLAVKTKSEYLKKTLWQLINAINSGSNMKGAMNLIIDELTSNQQAKIQTYARELNLWSLVYMMFAVAIPTIGATMLIILSAFSGIGIQPSFFIFFLGVCFFAQIAMLGLIKARRPAISY